MLNKEYAELRKPLYLEAYTEKMQRMIDAGVEADFAASDKKQVIYYGVMTVLTHAQVEPKTMEEAVLLYGNTDWILHLIGTLSPSQIESIFPIDKTYDGERWETKDYFYTRKILDGLPAGEPIEKTLSAFELLYDYENIYLRAFLVRHMHYIDCIRRFRGEKSAIEEWCEREGIQTYTMHTDHNGKQFLMESGTGKTIPVSKTKPRRPKWIHVIKPGKPN